MTAQRGERNGALCLACHENEVADRRTPQRSQHYRIFDEKNFRPGKPNGADQFRRGIAGIERRRDGSVHQDSLIDQIKFRAGFRTNGDMIAATDTERLQAGCDFFGRFEILHPGPRPDSIFAWLPQRQSIGVTRGRPAQNFGNRGGRACGCFHAVRKPVYYASQDHAQVTPTDAGEQLVSTRTTSTRHTALRGLLNCSPSRVAACAVSGVGVSPTISATRSWSS